jgi:xylan 1,4-beta-xylosidase
LVTGTGHGSIVEGPDGNLWQFYTIVLSNPPGGRRIGMDRITFDNEGKMAVNATETPQWAPSAIHDPAKGDSGSIPLTICKLRAMNALSRFSSEQPGHDAAYAVDNSSGTWWEPAATDQQPTLTIELSPATRFDAVQLFTIDSVRLMFNSGRGFAGRGRGGQGAGGAPSAPPPTTATTPAPAAASDTPPINAYQYKIEASLDGQTYTLALDQTKNTIPRNTSFEEIPPVKCRFVRLTLKNWPRTTPLGIIEFTVFGKPAESLPATQPNPAAR